MASFRTLANRALKRIMPKDISRRGMRIVYSSDTLMVRQRRGKHGGWMYADYKDVTTGRWIRNVRIRTGDYRSFLEYMEAHPVPKGLADRSGANFRTVLSENVTVKAVSYINKGIGILKAKAANGTKDDVLGEEWYDVLADAISRGDYRAIEAMVKEWFRVHTDEEIDDFFDYDDEDLEIFEGYL